MAGLNWVLDRSKFLSLAEAKQLLETARKWAETAALHSHKAPIRDYLIIHLALATGLRVMEIAQLNCGDLFAHDWGDALAVRNGKGGKRRLVWFDGKLRQHYEDYLDWKQANDEPVGPDDPLLQSSCTGGHLTTRAIEKAFKRVAARAGLSEHFSIHSLRHTYACQLYKASGYNLRLVQKQLGHSKSQTTEVYADVMMPDMQKALDRMYQ